METLLGKTVKVKTSTGYSLRIGTIAIVDKIQIYGNTTIYRLNYRESVSWYCRKDFTLIRNTLN